MTNYRAMKAMTSFAVTGFDDVDAMLSQLKPSSQKKILGRIMKKAMKPVLQDVQSNMPKDTGETAKAIKVQAGPRRKETIWYNVRPVKKVTGGKLDIDSKKTDLNALPKWIEFGSMNADGSWKVEPSHPYGEAYAANRASVQDAVVNDFSGEYQREIDRLARKSAGKSK